MLIKVFFGVGVLPPWLLEEDELGFEVAVVFVVDHRSLNGEVDAVHEWLAVG